MNVSLASVCSPNGDDRFGPAVQGCRQNFDFTFVFEQYIFTIIPVIILLIAAPLRIRYLYKLPKVIRGNSVKYAKLATLSLWSACHLALLIIWATTPSSGAIKTAAITSYCLSFAAGIVGLALSYNEHSKSMKPSTTITTYMFISLILDVATLRTTWLITMPAAIRIVFTMEFVLKGLILVLEAKEKREWLVDNQNRHSPEETSGIFNRGVFWWVNSLLASGFRQLLRPSDLFELQEDMLAAVLCERFWSSWDQDTHNSKYKLIIVCTRTLVWPILSAIPARSILVVFTICQPLLLNRFLLYLQEADESLNIGYGLIAAYGLVYIGMAISSAFYFHKAFRMATMLRGLLIAVIFKHTTEISIAASDNSASVTLMSTDVDTIVRAIRQLHDLWADVVQVAVATWLLSVFIGPAAAAPVAVCLLSLVLTIYVSPKARASQGAWFEKVQKRIGVTSKMLGHMKSVKMSGLAQELALSISRMRVDEMKAAKPFRLIMVCTAALAQVPVLVSPVAAFAVFAIVSARTGETFEATTLFSSLSLIILLAAPLFGTFETIINLQSSLACFERIQRYLCTPGRKDRRSKLSNGSQTTISKPGIRLSRGQNDHALGIMDDEIEMMTPPPHKPNTSEPHECVHIRLRDASFTWSDEGPVFVKHVNFVVMKSQFMVLVGAVASGKTTLLKGLLGECTGMSGDVMLAQARTSWCDQSPWIYNGTVRENIVGYGYYDSKLYHKVSYACDLLKDFSRFPDGDETLVGSKGLSLSGGQKQRVALARAIYSRPEIAIFDDVLSGLDNHTANTVCDRLFSHKCGILREWGTTIILATHSAVPLHMADQILVLGKDGGVAELGSPTELTIRDGYVKSIFEGNKFRMTEVEEIAASDDEKNALLTGALQLAKKSEPIDKRRQLGDNTVYQFYFSSLGLGLTAILLVVEFSNAFLQTFPTVWLKWWSDASTAGGNQSIGLYLGVYAALQMAAVAALVMVKIVTKSGLELHERLLRVVIRAPLSLFVSVDTGSLTTRFSQDLGEVDRSLPLGMLVTIQNLLTCIGQAVLIASSTWYLAIAYPFLLATFVFLQKAYLRTSRQLRFLDLEEKAPVYTQFLETLAGLLTVRAMNWTNRAIDRNHELVDRAQKPFYLLLMVQRWLTLVLDFIVATLALLVVGLAVKLRDSVSVGLTGVSLVQLITFAETVRMLILWWTSLETSIGAVARIKQFSESTPDENLPGEISVVPQEWPAHGSIEINSISASYAENKTKALDDVSISIKAGENVGIVGRTGSGKSSLLLTLARMLNMSAGSILIDGLDITALPREEVRSRLNIISQDQFFLPGTIRQNIDPHDTFSTEEILAVLLKLDLLGSVESNGGLDADMDEDMLSQGQRQLFFLGKAILRRNRGCVVLLDEATSSVDHETEASIRNLFRKEFETHTVVAVAHRLDTIIDFDRVIVMDNGAVIEQGRPTDLLQRSGPFQALWNAARVTSRS
ncbi:P-loop containing nucleoside triphosphate hydrolase protein [Truncatella angustata]|uniref:P-loop containing nucleoside triphosphate hydrolase protein n=1 Tax=Truncatella angustata TaxID=152316 RepID=A0A9P8UWL3_9PEZI|nr:P-loop containing nucleoside triphosphate hydrolase protein [Truncatella angustata]KAH6659682.1 P-loop containing nucleoside triphosphate hydrolase protein [Truncatella angustata]